jgi:lipoprotein-anchoring transpeptidase ErfK/SrfK
MKAYGGARLGACAATAAACLLLWGCGGDGGDKSTDSDQRASAPADEGTKLYFTGGEQFEKVDAGSPGAGPREAVEELLQGPPEKRTSSGVPVESQIPDGVELEDFGVDEAGTASVELSPGFTGGVPAEPSQRSREQQADIDARVAQVTYTLTQFDNVKDAKLVSGGVPVARSADREDFAAPAQGPKPVVKPRGAKLPGTRQVQTKLAKLRYLPKSAIDGVAGYQTQMAVVAFQAWEGLDRDGVVGPMTAAALETARRPKPRKGGPSKRIEVYRDKGVTLLVEGSRTRRAIHTSSGAAGTITPSGRFEVFRKELKSWSVPFQTWLPYASYFNNGIAFHEYPDVPPYPASHGCVRVPAPEAPGVYRFAAIGTTVVVY